MTGVIGASVPKHATAGGVSGSVFATVLTVRGIISARASERALRVATVMLALMGPRFDDDIKGITGGKHFSEIIAYFIFPSLFEHVY